MYHIEMFGKMRVWRGDQALERLPTRKAASLLALLAFQAERVFTREELYALFWPDEAEAAARHNLRQALYSLRRLLPPLAGIGDTLLTDNVSVQLRARAVTTDAALFESALRAADKAETRCLTRFAISIWAASIGIEAMWSRRARSTRRRTNTPDRL